MPETAIKIENAGKRYRIPVPTAKVDLLTDKGNNAFSRGAYRLLHAVTDAGRKKQDFWALRGINLEIRQGESVGIIGKNGAGKSTLLKLLSRITEPTEGRIAYTGRLASMLEVGTGFNGELTGRENVYLNGSILGMTKEEVDQKFEAILEFSEVGDFIDTPVKRYSSGMFVRLGFAVAAHLEPEIMIVDEVLAVGDARFQEKCLGQMNAVVESGRTVLFVSHQMPTIRRLCKRVIVLKEGRVIYDGETEKGVQLYLDEGGAFARTFDYSRTKRWAQSSGHLLIRSLELLHTNDCVYEPDGVVEFGVTMDCLLPVEVLCLRVGLVRGAVLVGSAFSVKTRLQKPFCPGETITLICRVPCAGLTAGQYNAVLTFSSGDTYEAYAPYDEVDPAFRFEVLAEKRGVLRENWNERWGLLRLRPAEFDRGQ
ncbi:MAG: ABC transporter ATP-binding protein [Oscillospiraceae bacterium]|jgi:lipopolysaccharide transport system ATP-binding protein|nr:ABC transporter ATP-binding protein [Oscillospiraceae bacterium]